MPSPWESLLILVGAVCLWRHRWLLDDAFVFFRYVDNWLFLGRGLVWNPGEYVEGFSSPLWCLLLAALRLTHVPFHILVAVSGYVIYLGICAAAIALNRFLSPEGAPAINLPLIIVTLTFGLQTWYASGMETGLSLLFAAGLAYAAASKRWRVFELTAAALPLVRPELLLTAVLALVWMAVVRRRSPKRGILLLVGFNAAWLLFRIYYYADFFPNTYYLKDLPWPDQGWNYLRDAFGPYGLAWIALLLLAGLALSLATGRIHPIHSAIGFRVLLLSCAFIQTAYVVKIGGDTWHMRLLAFPYLLVSFALAGIPEWVVHSWDAARYRWITSLGMALALAGITFGSWPWQSEFHPFLLRGRLQMVRGIEVPRLQSCRGMLRRYRTEAPSTGEYRNLRPGEHQTPKSLPVVATEWCVDAYFSPKARVINPFGLTDPVLARMSVPASLPGHKPALRRFARDLIGIVMRSGEKVRCRMYTEAAAGPEFVPWVQKNKDYIQLLEAKQFNQGCFFENLRLAWRTRRRFDPGFATGYGPIQPDRAPAFVCEEPTPLPNGGLAISAGKTIWTPPCVIPLRFQYGSGLPDYTLSVHINGIPCRVRVDDALLSEPVASLPFHGAYAAWIPFSHIFLSGTNRIAIEADGLPLHEIAFEAPREIWNLGLPER